jgi:putative acetyltransferase
MKRIHEGAAHRGIEILTSEASRTAQPFFENFGFVTVEQKSPVVRGVVVPNALMRKRLVRL